jgi:hypothetical protein
MDLTEHNNRLAPSDSNNAVELEVLKLKMRDIEKELKEVREMANEALRTAKRAKHAATFGN